MVEVADVDENGMEKGFSQSEGSTAYPLPSFLSHISCLFL
jgi:hypothetical protein